MLLNDPRRRRAMPPTAYRNGRLALTIFRWVMYLVGILGTTAWFVMAVSNFTASRGFMTLIIPIVALVILVAVQYLIVELICSLGRAIFDIADYSAYPDPIPKQVAAQGVSPSLHVHASLPPAEPAHETPEARLLAQVQAEEEAKARGMRHF